jgi:hypothetical protein
MASDAASRKGEIDAALRRAADVGALPVVVAMATDRDSVIYQGAFGKRVLGQTAPMTADTDDQGNHGRGCHAARRAGQARSRCPCRQGRSRYCLGASAGGFRRRRSAAHASTEVPDHAAPPPYPYGRLRLRDLERRHRQIPGGQEHSKHHHVPELGAPHARASWHRSI